MNCNTLNLDKNLKQIQQIITQTELENGRIPGSILLLAVSKQQSIETIIQACHLGITHFGENYFQEAQEKIKALKHLSLCWHFIGPIQSNKTKGIASSFNWVHSINRLKIAHQLNEYRPRELSPLNVCLQINLVEEETKSGIPPEQAHELALAVSQLPHLKLRGLMTIPPPQKSQQEQYPVYLKLNQLMHSLNNELGLTMDTLSMGMSDDFLAAIQAGATIIRLGRALFGERQK